MLNKKNKKIHLRNHSYNQLYIINDGSNWSLDHDARELNKIAKKLLINVSIQNDWQKIKKQSVYCTSMFELSNPEIFNHHNRLAFDYYHGKPGQQAEFTSVYKALKESHSNVSRIRVSQSEIEQLALETGIDNSKVFRIPIGIDTHLFTLQTSASKKNIREKLNLSQSDIVIGSFQKDGNGWEEGLEPKLIKGPDIFLKTLEILKLKFQNLHVLLTGPARGYIKAGLEKLNIPYTHQFLKNYNEIAEFYHALDVYLVTSREEGGPKAVLESMASGIPLVTTKVGQAIDLVSHTYNGWMVEKENYEEIAHWASFVLNNQHSIDEALKNARTTAEQNSYESQTLIWKKFFTGFVNY